MEYGLARTVPALAHRPRYEARPSEWLTDRFGRRYHQRDHKVFCVGFQRTGTTSMLDALRCLGYFGHRDAPWLLPSIEAGRPDLSIADDYDALADNPFPLLYR
jgi:Sulfotransferase domain